MTTENAFATMSSEPDEGKKYFTVSEANRALPYVSKIVNEVTECYKEAVAIRNQVERSQLQDDADRLHDEYEQAMDRLNGLLDELHQVGVELKDFEKGLLDFPAMHDGREVYLCWRSGEECVHSWHELDAGFAGRQDVSVLEVE